MKRLFAGLLLAAPLASAPAADAPPPATPAVMPAGKTAAPILEVAPQRRGYAADQPELLLRQRLFGRAHGLSLLAAACLEMPAYSKAVQDTYTAWYAKQARTIEAIVHDLAGYYFGPRADEAQWFDIAHALNLPDSIEPALGEVTLHAACASLPEAIPRSRYELDKLLAGSIDVEGPQQSELPAVAPAPTPPKPAE